MNPETAELVGTLLEQINRLTALVRTLLEMSNLVSVPRSDHIELAPLLDEILADLRRMRRKTASRSRTVRCISIVESERSVYRLLFNLIENGINTIVRTAPFPLPFIRKRIR